MADIVLCVPPSCLSGSDDETWRAWVGRVGHAPRFSTGGSGSIHEVNFGDWCYVVASGRVIGYGVIRQARRVTARRAEINVSGWCRARVTRPIDRSPWWRKNSSFKWAVYAWWPRSAVRLIAQSDALAS